MPLILLAVAEAEAGAGEHGHAKGAKEVDPGVHINAVQLVNGEAFRRDILADIRELTDEAKKQIVKKCHTCSQDFRNEWETRMIERMNASDCADIYVRVYERYFTAAELAELIALNQNQSPKRLGLSAPLKGKMSYVLLSITNETLRGCSQIVIKRANEIFAEIQRDHTESVRIPSKPDK